MNWKRFTNNRRLQTVSIGSASLLALCLFSGCKESIPDVFVIPAEATERDYISFQGANYVSFQLEERYPASEPIRQISDSLEKKGWQPLKEMFLHPAEPSSLVTGWNYLEDKKANQFVYEWSADWKDSRNNILSYTFRYIDRLEKYRQSTFVLRPNSNQLKVSAIYMPAKVAEVRKKHAAASTTN